MCEADNWYGDTDGMERVERKCEKYVWEGETDGMGGVKQKQMYDKAKQMEWRGSKKKRDRNRNAKQTFEKAKQMG